MSRTGAEAKPPWSAVPRALKDEIARLLGSPVARAERVYGGYAPSATFRMLLANGRRAFLKGVYPLTKDSGVKWDLENEERIYVDCAELMRPWAPAYLGGAKAEGWHVIVLEDVGPQTMPPWTPAKAGLGTQARVIPVGTHGPPSGGHSHFPSRSRPHSGRWTMALILETVSAPSSTVQV